MNTKVPVSVIVPVKNEATNIKACLESIVWADQIFVVDSDSRDQTCEIAARMGAEVVQFEFSGGWPKKKNWSLENLPFKHEWILLLDADERVTPDLADEIAKTVLHPNNCDGFYVNRRMIFLGRWIRHCGWYPSWNLRLFRHSRGRYERLTDASPFGTGDVEVHEHVVLDGKAGFLRHDLLHEDFKSISDFIERHNRYSTWESAVYAEFRNGRSGSRSIGASLLADPLQRKRWFKHLWVHLPMRPVIRFLWMYLFRLGILDGRPGFIFCTLMSFHEAMISAKSYEFQLKGV
jgi:glycosyltransferase involved in cell wall biosynthesis